MLVFFSKMRYTSYNYGRRKRQTNFSKTIQKELTVLTLVIAMPSRSFFATDTFASVVSTVNLGIGEMVNTCTLCKATCYTQVSTVNEKDTIKLRPMI